MRPYDIIKRKRDGEILSTEEIEFIIEAYVDGEVEDYQMSAFLMAIYFKGMDDRETLDLTYAMLNSGETIDLSKIAGIKVDKHSTGGVGDTTTLVVGPMIAALGIPFVKMSGRGLGHTGGTLDKLDSIEGFHTDLSYQELIDYTNKINICIAGQTDNITPADKKIYALRDVTATVDSLPLIASSVMSKKLALGSDKIVLDVKVGRGAFMKDVEQAFQLSEKMVAIGSGAGKETIALVTNMDQPLGNAVGNALEVKEALEILKGEHLDGDLYKVSLALAVELLILARLVDSKESGRKLLRETIDNGSAYKKFMDLVELQGGNLEVIRNWELFPHTKNIYRVKARATGYISDIDAEEIGKVSLYLGAGRENKNSIIDLAVGMVLEKRVGDYVKEGETLVTIHLDKIEKLKFAEERIIDIFKIDKNPKEKDKLIYGLVTSDGIEYL